jgi:hypothetical protein
VAPGARIQNWYCGLAQPVARAVKVTALPAGTEAAGEVITLTVEHELKV